MHWEPQLLKMWVQLYWLQTAWPLFVKIYRRIRVVKTSLFRASQTLFCCFDDHTTLDETVWKSVHFLSYLWALLTHSNMTMHVTAGHFDSRHGCYGQACLPSFPFHLRKAQAGHPQRPFLMVLPRWPPAYAFMLAQQVIHNNVHWHITFICVRRVHGCSRTCIHWSAVAKQIGFAQGSAACVRILTSFPSCSSYNCSQRRHASWAVSLCAYWQHTANAIHKLRVQPVMMIHLSIHNTIRSMNDPYARTVTA